MARTLLALAAVALFSCGNGNSSSAGGTCAGYAACGGNVVGSWVLSEECLVGSAGVASCPSATATISTPATGTATFGTDGTYSSAFTATPTESLTMPGSCLTGVSDCTAFATSLAKQAGIKSATCTGTVATSCQCQVGLPSTSSTESGTYTTAGNNLTLLPTGSAPLTVTYCAQGTSLKTQEIDSTGQTITIVGHK
ncbi:MAG: hypothetical protein ACHREM_31005 [Polyangiales bacterium]